ncbi:MAG: amidase [Burkholderiales bacterium]
MAATELCFLSATELVHRIGSRDVSALEVTEAHLAQIERCNPLVNAIVTLVEDQARDAAKAADERQTRGETLGVLHGLPMVHKDLAETKGIRTTFGSPIFKDFVPGRTALLVERMQQAGGITLGKSNTPEFGAGSQTYNEVFGETLNPYGLPKRRLTCGGSSGGAAVALACGMAPIADGTDFGGSLRNPASFCNVVGFRPSPGRVPNWPALAAWFPFTIAGPMARSVEDIALMMTAIAGPDARSPISLPESGADFLQPLQRDFKKTRIAWSPDLNHLFHIDPSVVQVIEKQLPAFSALGCDVAEAAPDLSGADDIFRVWRAWSMHLNFGELYKTQRGRMKDTVRWNIEEGAKLTGADIARAEQLRTELYHRVREFFDRYDYLLLPVVQVLPFDVKERWVKSINGIELPTYLDWMKSCYLISATTLPCLSIPAGFTDDGLPIGLQIVGKHNADFSVLQLAYGFEQATGFGLRRPTICNRHV